MATTVSHQRIPRNPRAGIAPRLTKIKTALDQVIPKQRTAIPSVQGIAEQKRVLECVNRMSNVVDSIRLVNDAAEQTNDPDLQSYAASLMSDPRFLRLIGSHVEQIRAMVEKAIGTPPAQAMEAAEEPAPQDPDNPDFEDQGPNAGANHQPTRGGGSGLPGTDAAPGPYTVEHLRRDLATRAMAPRFFEQRNSRGGMDAALGEVAKIRFFPDWSAEWTPEARQAFRDAASFDNGLAEVLRSHGDSPTYQNEYNAARSSVFADYLKD